MTRSTVGETTALHDLARDVVERELGKHARPARMILVDELDLLASGKPDREAIRRAVAGLR